MKVNGNLYGIKDSYIQVLEGIYGIDTPLGDIISVEMLDILVKMTDLIGREISVYINRRGKVLDVSVGDSSTVNLPLLDLRRGERRLSGIRCVHTHPQGSGYLSKVDLSALIGLRLDTIASIGVNEGVCGDIYVGFLVPDSGTLSDVYRIDGPYSKDTVNSINILESVKQIDREISGNLPQETGDTRKERVILVGLDLSNAEGSSEDLLDELEELAKTANAEIVEKILQKRDKVDNAYYIGSGKARELGLIGQAYEIDTIIFDDELSGAQVRNLEEITGLRVIDRTALILDIFAGRAQSREGKLQVELAQLKYRLPRLIGLGRELSRTGGGIGTRGPGEKKLEIDRRHIRERIVELEEELEEVRKNRNTQREKRRTSRIPIVSLVGYTNSGKSTLRNYLARTYQSDLSINKEDVLEANMFFATLDPTTRLIKLPGGHEVLVSDTVGFIRKLPHALVEAFKATLEEVEYSDLLVHVVDSSALNVMEQIDAVNEVLKQLEVLDKPMIIAYNKIDKLHNGDIMSLASESPADVMRVSALYGEGMIGFVSLLENKLFSSMRTVKLKLPYSRMNIKSDLYNEFKVVSEEYLEDSAVITVEIDEAGCGKYKNYIV